MRSLYQASADYFRKVNWSLLLFLLLVLNVKMLVKIPVILILLFLNRKMLTEKGFYRQKFVWFYFSMIGIALINLLLSASSLSVNYIVAVATGIGFWLLCIATAFLNYQFVMKTDTRKLQNTITLFFILNVAVTISQLLFIIWDAGSLNPYTYQGMYQKYFTNTGDRIIGITFDVSTTNAILNAFAVIYFLYLRKMRLVLLCMATLLLTASNFTNILLGIVLLFIFISQSTKNQKSIIVVCFCMLAIFLVRVSPQNTQYVNESFQKMADEKDKRIIKKQDGIPLTQKPDSSLNPEQRRRKIAMLYLDSVAKELGPKNIADIKPSVPQPNIHTEPFQRKRDTSLFQKKLLQFAATQIQTFDTSLKKTKARQLPGKLIAFEQTFQYLKQHPLRILTGSGTGNFASKLAFRATGLQITGGYPQKLSYISHDFLNNHLKLYLDYFSKDIELHSLIHNPYSVYDQLIAEYGLAGIIAFLFFYLRYFLNHTKKRSYGLPLLLILLGVFGVDYWYEQLSVVVLFELMMLLDIKNMSQQND